MEQKHVRVRFAPSPTGYLHIGNLRAAIFNWLFARHHGGQFLLRIEDTDRERSKEEYQAYMLESLNWIGIDFDEEPVIQSSRIETHKAVVEKLIAEGKAYKCYCTQQEIEQRYLDRLKMSEGSNATADLYSKYDRHCATQRLVDAAQDTPYVVRFKLPEEKEIIFHDLVRGEIKFDINQFDDFIIVRSDGTPVYNLAVVSDDNFMNITHVIRGEDHISNTPKQIMLYRACGYREPQFAHVPLILGPSGDKLSKRDAAVSVLEYRDQGFLPEALFNYLVRLGWSHGDQEVFSKQELIELFDLDGVGKKGAIFDIEKLQWLNGVYLREKSAQDVKEILQKDLRIKFEDRFADWQEAQLLKVVDLYKERVRTLVELVEQVALLYAGPKKYDQQAIEKFVTPDTKKHLIALIGILERLDMCEFIHDILAQQVKALSKELGIKLVALAQPIRISLTGSTTSPGVFELLEIIGKQESVKRLHAFLETL